MAQTWQSLIMQGRESPQDRLLTLATYPETASVFTYHDDWQHRSIAGLFAAQVALTPLASAIVFHHPIFGDQLVSYTDLDAISNQFAHSLQRAGIGPERLIAIYTEHGADVPQVVAAILGIWKARAAYIFLPADRDEGRQQFILEQSQPTMILTTTRLRSRLPVTTGSRIPQIVLLDDATTAVRISEEPTTPPALETNAEALAYVIYTSGTSTGRPKGVQVTQRYLPELAAALINLFGVKPGDRLSQMLPLGFDASLSEILPALLSGAALYPLPREQGLAGLTTFLCEHEITLAQIPPSLLPELTEAELPRLRTIATGGSRIAPEVARQLTQQGKTVITCYGLTEAVTCSVAGVVTGQESLDYPWTYVGKPFPYVEVLILGEDGQSHSHGEQGEIALSPAARGYIDPTLDSPRFMLTPDGRRFCRTGDLGKIDPATGSLLFWGRQDTDTVKTPGGEMVSFPAIEAVLLAYRPPLIKECLVLMREESPGASQLVAYVVSDQNASTFDHPALRRHLASFLPPFQVPVACVSVSALTRTELSKAPRDPKLYPPPSNEDMLSFDPSHVARDEFELQLAALVIEIARSNATPQTLNFALPLRPLGITSAKFALFLESVQQTFHLTDMAPLNITGDSLDEIAQAIKQRIPAP
jgi:acyl-coenzyme A synthetase/AMP-(fatty) acid ligase